MKQIYTLIVLAGILLAGCGGGLKDKVVGTWKFDASTLEFPGLTPEMKKAPAFAEQTKVFDKARMEFKADGTYSGTGMGEDGGGKWTLTDHTISVTSDKKESKETPKLTLSDDGTKIHMAGPSPTGSGEMKMDMVKAG